MLLNSKLIISDFLIFFLINGMKLKDYFRGGY